jgi:hypothetical protein
MSTSILSDDHYWSFVDELIVRQSACGSLSELAHRLPGVYPTDILQRLDVLSGRLTHDEVADLRRFEQQATVLEALSSVLPLPHPLDFEWRFTAGSCSDLLERSITSLGAKRVALLGTPRLAEFLGSNNLGVDATLFELRHEACKALEGVGDTNVVCADLAYEDIEPYAGFDLVIADPPWYPALMQVFIHAAARLLVPGGHLLLCSPGIGTRPSITAERLQTVEFAHEHGLVNTEILQNSLTYESPPFEVAALAASGLGGFRADWRRGDLLVFARAGDPQPFSPDLDPAASSPWTEVVVENSRIRVRATGSPAYGYLASVVPGNVLDSVSRRDPRRQAPNVWTSTNHVYKTGEPAALIEALAAYDQRPETSYSDSEAADAASMIVAAERDCLRSFTQIE